MSLLTKTQKVPPANALQEELIEARNYYDEVRAYVIDTAVQRQEAIEGTIRDLRTESDELEAVVQGAQKG